MSAVGVGGPVFRLKACWHCRGDLRREADGMWTCFQCGRSDGSQPEEAPSHTNRGPKRTRWEVLR